MLERGSCAYKGSRQRSGTDDDTRGPLLESHLQEPGFILRMWVVVEETASREPCDWVRLLCGEWMEKYKQTYMCVCVHSLTARKGTVPANGLCPYSLSETMVPTVA